MEHVLHLVLDHGYVLIFVLVLFDQAAVSIPSPPFVTAMGVLASRGHFNILIAFAVVFCAAFTADWLWFRIGSSARSHLSRQVCPRHWLNRFQEIVTGTHRGIPGAILGVKFSLLPSALVPLTAGSSGLTTRRFVCMAAFGNLAWTTAYLIGGFVAGYAIMNVLSRRTVLIFVSLGSCVLPTVFSLLHFAFESRHRRFKHTH
jgi:membrane protein DedA with SNARE-associated domain